MSRTELVLERLDAVLSEQARISQRLADLEAERAPGTGVQLVSPPASSGA